MSAIAHESSDIPWEQLLEDLPRAELTQLLLQAASVAASASERAALEVRVIEANMEVARQIATRYRGRGIATDDLEQVSYLALVKAVRRYIYAEDRDFLSFAVPTIRGEIRRCFRDQGWTIRPPRCVQEAQARIREVEEDLLQELGRPPRPDEIAELSGLEVDLVVEARAAAGCFTPGSLDTSTSSLDGGPVAEWLGDVDPDFECVEARTVLAPLWGSLTARERRLLELRFFRGATQKEIGDTIGVTQMQVSRLLANLMGRLRQQLTSDDDVDAHERAPTAPA